MSKRTKSIMCDTDFFYFLNGSHSGFRFWTLLEPEVEAHTIASRWQEGSLESRVPNSEKFQI
eukprot:5859863-Amphidinium_carterae.1